MASRPRLSLPKEDQKLVQIVDAALAETARRSREWLACRPGCTPCCVGVFAVNSLDVARLRAGMDALADVDPERARRIRERARESRERLGSSFPGNSRTGVLGKSKEAEERFAEFGNEEACPVLDPATGLCDLYEWRPMTCRTFGPPVRSEDGLGVCELCYHGATDEEIAACEMVPDPEDLESKLVKKIESAGGRRGQTIVAWAIGEARE